MAKSGGRRGARMLALGLMVSVPPLRTVSAADGGTSAWQSSAARSPVAAPRKLSPQHPQADSRLHASNTDRAAHGPTPLIPQAPFVANPKLPFATQGRHIVDATGAPVRLVSVNVPGASDRAHILYGLDRIALHDYALLVKEAGFNSVRLPFSNAMLRTKAPPPDGLLRANAEGPHDLRGQTPLSIFERTVKAFTDQGIWVILNNHSTQGYWCCTTDDGNEFWDSGQTTEDWLSDWETMAQLFRDNPWVIGADLRNELRPAPREGRTPNWAGYVSESPTSPPPYHPANDWSLAVTVASQRIAPYRPDWLIIVEGLNYSNDFRFLKHHPPPTLAIPHRLVYSPHVYGHQDTTDYEDAWAFILDAPEPWVAPLWIGEFGVGPTPDPWWNRIVQLIADKDLSVAYWSMNAERFPNTQGVFDTIEEPFGILHVQRVGGEVRWVLDPQDFRVQALRGFLPKPPRGAP